MRWLKFDEASGGLPLEDCLSCAEACELHARFEAALHELESVDIEDALPPAVGFAEPSILVELSATRESLQVAILQTRTAMEQMQAIAESGADEDDGVGSRMQSTRRRSGSITLTLRSCPSQSACCCGRWKICCV